MESNIGNYLIYIIPALIIVLLIWLVVIFNRFVVLRNKIKQSKSSIDIYLTQRFNLIPNLVEVVKGYCKYEEETLTKVAELRTQYGKTKSLDAGEKLDKEFKSLFAVAEANPDLKANEQFTKLANTLEKMESQLQAARRVYNGDVTLFNTTIETFPNVLFAGLFGMHKEKLFEADENSKENVNVKI